MSIQLLQGDCLEVMKTLPAQSVEAIITDLPYGTTACAWDEVIPFAPMWEQVKRILKPRGVFVTTASQPFTSKLVMSNPDWFKYCWVWEKPQGVDPFMRDVRPLNNIEDIVVFSKEGHTYNPQLVKGKAYTATRDRNSRTLETTGTQMKQTTTVNPGFRYPLRVLSFGRMTGDHPTQKPVALYEYLILTYTHPGETVLDICAGSGTTGEAAIKTGRNCILIEKKPEYFGIIQNRMAQVQAQPLLFEVSA
jgi:site-specific DNA-methyltransferase (adenine-specific)